MNKFLFILTLSFGFMACGGNAEHKDEAATTSTTATSAEKTQAAAPALPAVKPPFEIKDSSKVMVLEGGVKLYPIQEGSGVAPTPETTVLAHYNGRLKDGSVFDSSFERGEPTSFPLNGVIKGWTVAFTKMKPGSRFVLVIPAEMGYGANSPSPKIPANATLIFDCDFITTL